MMYETDLEILRKSVREDFYNKMGYDTKVSSEALKARRENNRDFDEQVARLIGDETLGLIYRDNEGTVVYKKVNKK